MSSYVSHLEAALDGTCLRAREQHTLHEGRPIWVRYDLDAVSRALDKEILRKRPATLWRYRELLPVEDNKSIVSLGEGMSPLLRCERLGSLLGLKNLFIKDESQMPTGSFKDRGQTVAISMAKWFGVKRVAIPTAGNAGGSMAAYAARAGMEAFVFMPEDTPEINQYEAVQAGAYTYLVNGLINIGEHPEMHEISDELERLAVQFPGQFTHHDRRLKRDDLRIGLGNISGFS